MKCLIVSTSIEAPTESFISSSATSITTQMISEATTIISRLKSFKAGTRDCLKSELGIWFFVRSLQAVYLTLTISNYPQRLAFDALEKFQTIHLANKEQKKLSSFRKESQALLKKFEKTESFDQLEKANNHINNLNNHANTMMEKLLIEDDRLNDLHDNAMKMNEEAKNYEKETKRLKWNMLFAKYKYFILATLIGVTVIVLIFIMMKM